ncbi:MAG: response regulator [Desulfovibrionaceae bacterium]|nr:response regulator [Desulfovibrionaceae bacterium]
MSNAIFQKQNILIIDDSEINLKILSYMLQDHYHLEIACGGREGIEKIMYFGQKLDLILLDLVMPEVDGFDVLHEMKHLKLINKIPVIIISNDNSSETLHRGYVEGAMEFLERGIQKTVLLRRIQNILEIQKYYLLQHQRSQQTQEQDALVLINILSSLVEFRSSESGPHMFHLIGLTKFFLNALLEYTDRYVISRTDCNLIAIASSLHDIGKLSVPDAVLKKPEKLTCSEFEIMKQHALEGAEMLAHMPLFPQDRMICFAYKIARWHHERWDGRGYPDGLAGDAVPIAVQVVSLADAYDALRSERVYKPSFSHEKSVAMILNGECGIFNPVLFRLLREYSENLNSFFKEMLSLLSQASSSIRDLLELPDRFLEK